MRRESFYVDMLICEDDELPNEVELEKFCEMLQEELPELQIVSATVSRNSATNLALSLVIEHVFNEALSEYGDRGRGRFAGRPGAARERSSFLILFILAHPLPSLPPGFDLARN